ncbi:hypothetical protein [Deinococcus cellulosilyticus]|uniref:Uncharacterized protein n=1 Tax=Deinococcus cellulosilyticus (strain DSM 18568 / NBRC 106333 / KACC 11606 / 5516J-15) TaxID=1223518 RepID=A0A511N0X1_DEIC1|nr:hypothetical protein [Deinococcus cellulosilyticus]GEM46111.1 hypothetical protein DC3_17460 [Deinococcus cellulosilyticus NBRC 106333 = KACC 11606]
MDQPTMLFEIQAEPFEYAYGFWITAAREHGDHDFKEVVLLPDGTPWIMTRGEHTLTLELGEETQKTLRFYKSRSGCFQGTYTHLATVNLTVPEGMLWVGDIIYDVRPDRPTHPAVQVNPTTTVEIYTDLQDPDFFLTQNKTSYICIS